MSFIFKWFIPTWLKRYMIEIDEEKEAREIFYARQSHEIQYKNIMTDLLKSTYKKRKELDFYADSCAINVRLQMVIKNRYNLRSRKQQNQQVEYGRLSNWLTKIDEIRESKKKIK